MGTPREIELKLRIDPDNSAALRRSDWWRSLGKGRRKTLHGTYFDTIDWLLRDSGIDLRIRVDGSSFLQTIKTQAEAGAGVGRHEWEALVPDAVPEPSLVIDPALPEEVRQLTASDVKPIFEVAVTRDIRKIQVRDTEIELAFDSGVITGGDRQQPLCEVELELKSGEVDELFSEARKINGIVPTRLHLRTKSDVGYSLADGGTKSWSKAPKLDLSPEMTAAEALASIIANCLNHLTANDTCAIRNDHEEGVHQSRVALRRLRSAFKIFEPVFGPDDLTTISEEVRWAATEMGPARDLDVLQADLLDPVREAADDDKIVSILMARADGLRAGAYDAVRSALTSQRYGEMLIELCALMQACAGETSRKGPLAAPVTEFAVDAMDTLHKKLLKRGKKFEKLSTADRHRVRIAVKKMRYVVEFFGGLFDNKKKKRFTKTLAALQDDLGRLNDVAMAETMLARLTEPVAGAGETSEIDHQAERDVAIAAGQVLGWHQRRAAEIDRELIKDWYAFAETRPFWRD